MGFIGGESFEFGFYRRDFQYGNYNVEVGIVDESEGQGQCEYIDNKIQNQIDRVFDQMNFSRVWILQVKWLMILCL